MAGYIPKKERVQAQLQPSTPQVTLTTNIPEQPTKKHGVGWWIGMVLLWICFLPIMATIFVAKNKKLQTPAKIGIIAAIWIVCLLITAFYPKSNDASNTNQANTSISQSSSAAANISSKSDSNEKASKNEETTFKASGNRGQRFVANFNHQNPNIQIADEQMNKWMSGAGEAYTITFEPFVVELSISDGEDTITCSTSLDESELSRFFDFAKKAFAAEGIEFTDDNITKLQEMERPYYGSVDSADGKRFFLLKEKSGKGDNYTFEIFTCKNYPYR